MNSKNFKSQTVFIYYNAKAKFCLFFSWSDQTNLRLVTCAVYSIEYSIIEHCGFLHVINFWKPKTARVYKDTEMALGKGEWVIE